MRRLFFAVIALVLSLSFVSCSSSPEEKIIDSMEEMTSFVKGFHIKSADDITKLNDKLEKFKTEIGEAVEGLYKEKQEELLEMAGNLSRLDEKIDKMTKDIEKEGKRLEKEAEAAGLDISEFEDLF